jgi:hypothetical protein
MRPAQTLCPCSVIAALLCSSSVALAEAPPDIVSTSTSAHASPIGVPLRAEGALDLVRSEDAGWAPGMRVTGLLLLGPVELGLTAGGETQLFGYTRSGVAALAGLRVRLGAWELDAAALLGSAYTHTGHALLDDDPGAGGWVESAGARAGVSWLPLRSENGGTNAGLGLSLSYERDLDPRVIGYSYTECGLSWECGGVQSKSVTLGTQRLAVHFVVVLALD